MPSTLGFGPSPERRGAPAAVAHYATDDPDVAVRTAAIEALGQTRRREAVPVLARTFDH